MVQQKDAAAIYRHANMQQHATLLAEQPVRITTHAFSTKLEDLLWYIECVLDKLSQLHVGCWTTFPKQMKCSRAFLTLCLDAYVMMQPGGCASMVSAPLHYDIKATSDTVQGSTNVQRWLKVHDEWTS